MPSSNPSLMGPQPPPPSPGLKDRWLRLPLVQKGAAGALVLVLGLGVATGALPLLTVTVVLALVALLLFLHPWARAITPTGIVAAGAAAAFTRDVETLAAVETVEAVMLAVALAAAVATFAGKNAPA